MAQALALIALIAAAVGALGPADPVRSTYAWPPPTLPAGTPSTAWYSPLLLIRHRPELVAASIPCSLPRALPRAERPLTVLATARLPSRVGGLEITGQAGRLVVSVGETILARVGRPAGGGQGGACAYSLRLAGGRWSLDGPGNRSLGGSLAAMPVVSGLFSGLDLRGATAPTVEVTTAVHGSRTLLRQSVAWMLACICALAALALVAFDRRPRPRLAARAVLRGALAHAHPADALVAIVLVAWWVLSPLFADDGWIIARERMFPVSGGFSSYYDSFGANLPNDYWLEWLQHWLADSSLLVIRIPALLSLAAIWTLCRFVLARVLRLSHDERTVVLLTLAGAFLVGALSWGMTLRPEPITALIVTAVLACVVSFLQQQNAAPIALAAVLIPLGVTGHYAAVTALAPLLVAGPTIVRWARAELASATTIVASSIALFAILLFVGADLEQRRANAATFASFSVGQNWRSESIRYFLLLEFPYGTPIRRASVALAALAVLAFVLRRRRRREPLVDLPAASLAVALILLLATPSKHPWHFGALIGLAALAVAVETRRLRLEVAEQQGWTARPFVAIGAVVVAIAWSWSPRFAWNGVDLRTLDWTLDLEKRVGLSQLAIALPLAALALAVLTDALRRNRPLWHAPSRVAFRTGVLFTAPLVAFTLSVLTIDAAKTHGWTLARQNLGALTSDVGCGLADDLAVADPRSARSLAAFEPSEYAVPSWIPPAPVANLPRFALGPGRRGSATRSPWFGLSGDERIGLFVAGVPSLSDRLGFEWGRVRDGDITQLGTATISSAFASEANAELPWRFVAAGELPTPDERANAVRVVLESAAAPGASIAVTPPVTYTNRPLSEMLARRDARPLVLPSLQPAFPCARLPQLSDGVVEPPDHIVVPRDSRSPLRFSFSPFQHVLDLYGLERVPLADSANPPQNFVVFKVEKTIPGARIARPVRVAAAS